MAIVYACKHCKKVIGKIDDQHLDTSRLGFDSLSDEDKATMIQMHDNGDVEIQTICEPCQTSLIKNPQYHELDYFLQ